jgi:hypothetical protein
VGCSVSGTIRPLPNIPPFFFYYAKERAALLKESMKLSHCLLSIIVVASLNICATCQRAKVTRAPEAKEWHFVVSGDSRNCGDFIMPVIAQGAARHKAAFYWHLGDFRAMRAPDQDLLGELDASGKTKILTLQLYHEQAWDDFVKMQVAPFETHGIPVFLGIGNHELIPPKDRSQYIDKFAKWIDSSIIKTQRLKDNPKASGARTYYHWQQGGVDFINLDNASHDQFDSEQLAWFNRVLNQDRRDPSIQTVVVGMHKSLPDSTSNWHSMAESPEGTQSGRCAYKTLAKLQREGKKRVYILASHSHFYMPDIYDTPFWRSTQSTNQTILPGWIIGTAGAVRYRLPENPPRQARTDVYGYLLATVNAGGKPGEIEFEFKQIHNRKDEGEDFIPDNVKQMFSREANKYCLDGNSDMSPAKVLPEPPDAPCTEIQ